MSIKNMSPETLLKSPSLLDFSYLRYILMEREVFNVVPMVNLECLRIYPIIRMIYRRKRIYSIIWMIYRWKIKLELKIKYQRSFLYGLHQKSTTQPAKNFAKSPKKEKENNVKLRRSVLNSHVADPERCKLWWGSNQFMVPSLLL